MTDNPLIAHDFRVAAAQYYHEESQRLSQVAYKLEDEVRSELRPVIPQVGDIVEVTNKSGRLLGRLPLFEVVAVTEGGVYCEHRSSSDGYHCAGFEHTAYNFNIRTKHDDRRYPSIVTFIHQPGGNQ